MEGGSWDAFWNSLVGISTKDEELPVLDGQVEEVAEANEEGSETNFYSQMETTEAIAFMKPKCF